MIAGIVFMLSVAWLYSRYELKAGLKAGSPSLVADAKHIATDMFSFLVILVAIVGTYLGFPLDRYRDSRCSTDSIHGADYIHWFF